MIELVPPITDEQILALRVGDPVSITGVILTGRDAAHKFMVERLIAVPEVSEADRELYEELKRTLAGGVIYHSGPIVRPGGGGWEFVSAGPTTSIRTEIYEDQVIAHFGVKVVIGKGGMGPRTLAACREHRAIYLHGVGGAGALSAQSVERVLGVYKLEFGPPEAMWKLQVRNFSGVVTMDAHGASLHDQVEERSKGMLRELLGSAS